MISNGEKGSIAKTERQQWHYLAVKKLSALLRGMNEKHLTFSFEWETSDYTIYSRMVSNMSNFLDVTVSLMGGKMSTDLYLKATDSINISTVFRVTYIIAKREFHTAKPLV